MNASSLLIQCYNLNCVKPQKQKFDVEDVSKNELQVPQGKVGIESAQVQSIERKSMNPALNIDWW